MKTYTIPLKLLIAEYVACDLQYLNFKLEKGKATYSIDLKSECIKGNKIKAYTNNGNEYFFDLDVKIQYIGRYMRSIWDYWKFNGSHVFNTWLKKNGGFDFSICYRDSCTYHENDKCRKTYNDNCTYKMSKI